MSCNFCCKQDKYDDRDIGAIKFELHQATDRQRKYIASLIDEVGQKWTAKKFEHAHAEARDEMLNKGEASRWIARLLRIRTMQQYWAS